MIVKSINPPRDRSPIALELIKLFAADYDKNKGKVASILTSPARTAKEQ